MVKTYTFDGPEPNLELPLEALGLVTITTKIEWLGETDTEPDPMRERVSKGICLSFTPFVQAALLKE
jgi:hypothetical protein